MLHTQPSQVIILYIIYTSKGYQQLVHALAALWPTFSVELQGVAVYLQSVAAHSTVGLLCSYLYLCGICPAERADISATYLTDIN